jgi:hypothetical protein
MKRALLKAGLMAGLVVFPITGVGCFFFCVIIQLSSEGNSRPFEEVMRESRPFCIGGWLSFIAFVACLIVLLIISRKPKGSH